MTRLSIVILLALATTASAEPYHPYAVSPGPAPEPAPFVEAGYVGGGAGVTVDHFLNAFVNLEGGLRLAKLPVWAWASAAYGASADVEGGGRYLQLRAGAEARSCTSERFCVYLGLFGGTQRQTWEKVDEMTEHHGGPLVGGRLGLDAGSTFTRFRVGVEAYRYQHTVEIGSFSEKGAEGGGGLTLAVIHRM